jgi:WD40 repeat protein
MEEEEEIKKEIHNVSFTTDKSIFSFGTEKGFVVCRIHPFNVMSIQDLQTGILFAEIIGNSNIIALVGDGKNPKYADTKLIFYDDSQSKFLSEVKFSTSIKNIKVTTNDLYVISSNTLYIFETSTLINKEKYDTIENNENGVFAVSRNKNKKTFAFPDKEIGHINIVEYNINQEKTQKKISAHVSRIACLSISDDSTYIASASDTGTLIRIFNIENGELNYEFRRGTEKALIFSIDFSHTNDFLSCTSDRGTVHIFNLKKKNEQPLQNVQKGFFNNLKRLLKTPSNVISAPRSFACFKIPDLKTFCVFGPDEQLYIVSADGDGKFYEVKFDKDKGGETNDADVYNILEENKNNP